MATKQIKAIRSTIWGRSVVVSALIVSALYLSASPLAQYPFPGPGRAAAGGGGGGGCTPASFSDNFDRADGDSLGANWTEAAGDADIFSNTLRVSTGSFGMVTAIHNTSTGTGCTAQYVIATIGSDAQYPTLYMRYTDGSNKFYGFQLDGNSGDFEWYKYDNAADSSGDLIASIDSGSVLVSQSIGITIEGTGNNTVVRIWRGVTGTPSSPTNWNGDTTPDGTSTADPGANAVDSGDKVGVGGQQGTADTLRWNDFAGGGIS